MDEKKEGVTGLNGWDVLGLALLCGTIVAVVWLFTN